MMIANYTGPSNSTTVLEHLPGEKIAASFIDDRDHIVIVFESGYSLVIRTADGSVAPISGESQTETAKVVMKQKERLHALNAMMGSLR